LSFASDPAYAPHVTRSVKGQRSLCPVSISLDIFGDRWSLLIVRDLMVRGYRTFGEFLRAGEGIATNVLADRLKQLQSHGLISAEAMANDRRAMKYRLTEKGIELAPLLLELLIWAGRHEKTGAPAKFIGDLASNREAVLQETRRRWQNGDSTPLIPPFRTPGRGRA
jgi:DNA-binding HxlR family transcriptional regulator